VGARHVEEPIPRVENGMNALNPTKLPEGASFTKDCLLPVERRYLMAASTEEV